MQRFDLNSSFIQQVAFDSTDSSMHVTFKGGRVHRYPNCNEAMVAEFVSEDSSGDYFNKKIRGLPHTRVDK